MKKLFLNITLILLSTANQQFNARVRQELETLLWKMQTYHNEISKIAANQDILKDATSYTTAQFDKFYLIAQQKVSLAERIVNDLDAKT